MKNKAIQKAFAHQFEVDEGSVHITFTATTDKGYEFDVEISDTRTPNEVTISRHTCLIKTTQYRKYTAKI